MPTDASSSTNKPKKAERLTPKELIEKHLKDPNHHVTDEELRNLKVGTEAENEADLNAAAESRKDEIDGLPDNDTLPNPYQVLK